MGGQVIDYFASRAPRVFEHTSTFDHVKDAIQVVLTLLRLGKRWRALERLNGELASAMLWNLELYREYIDLARHYLAIKLPIHQAGGSNHEVGNADLWSDYSICSAKLDKQKKP